MSFIQRELDRLSSALRDGQTKPDVYAQVYAAQQALAWAMEPTGFASPTTMIGRAGGLKDTQEGTEDCSGPHHLPQS